MSDLVKRADEVLKDVTPGPWRPGSSEFYPGLDGPLTKRVYTDHPPTEFELTGDNLRANARFIAAARELVPAMRDRIEADAKRIAELEDSRNRLDDRIAELVEKNGQACVRAETAEDRAEAAEARVKELEAANARLRGVLSGHQIWDSAEKVSADEFVLWAPDGHVAIRLKVTHRHDQLSEAGLEFLTCDLLDLLNARAALEGEK